MPVSNPLPRRGRPFVAAAFLAVLSVSCFDAASGPGGIPAGVLHFTPTYALRSAPDIVPFTSVRVRLFRGSGTNVIAVDTTISYPAGADSLAVNLNVPIQSITGSESFDLNLAMINSAGDTVFRATGPVTVRTSSSSGGGTPAPIQLPTRYVGTGSNAASLRFSTRDTSGRFGDTITLAATAFSSTGSALPGTPIEYRALDTTFVRVPAPGTPRFVLRNARGVTRVIARTLTGQSDTANITIRPVPSALVLHAGNGQSGPAGTALPTQIAARVMAADGLPVEGARVRFTVAEPATTGGSVRDTIVASNADGIAATQWTLGTRPGAASASAAAADFPSVPALSFSASVIHGPPSELLFTSPPVNTIAGATMTPPVTVTLRDAFGNVATTFSGTVTLAITEATARGAALSGVTTAPASSGVATFSSLSIAKANTGYALKATSGALAATSPTFDVTAGAPTRLVYRTGPVTTTAAPTMRSLVVEAHDALGNIAPAFTGIVTLSSTTGVGTTRDGIPVPAVPDSLKPKATAFAGVATFAAVPATIAVNGVSLTASSGTLTPAVSDTFSILPAAPSVLRFSVNPPATIVAGAVIDPGVQLRVEDAFGNRTTYGDSVFLALSGGPSGASLAGTKRLRAIDGRATFTGLSVALAGSGYALSASAPSAAGLAPATSSGFAVNPGAAASMAVVTMPSTGTSGVTLAPAPSVRLRDASGNNVSSSGVPVTVSVSTGGTLSGTTSVTTDASGVATFAGLAINGPTGSYTLTFSSSAGTIASAPIAISSGIMSLVFASQPGSVVAGNALRSDAIVVEMRNDAGALVTSFNDVVTLSVRARTVTGGGSLTDASWGSFSEEVTLIGTKTVTASGGIASFPSPLKVTKAGTWELVATAGGTGASAGQGISNSFTISAAPLHHLAFTQHPVTIGRGAPQPADVIVSAFDEFGNKVPFTATSPTLTLVHASATGTLTHDPAVITGSDAKFAAVKVMDASGSGFTLRVNAGTLQAVSNPFDVTHTATVAEITAITPNVAYLVEGSASHVVTFRALDELEVPVSGATIRFTEFDYDLGMVPGTVSATSAITNASGQVSVTWTPSGTGTRYLIAHTDDFAIGGSEVPEFTGVFHFLHAVVRPATTTKTWKGGIASDPHKYAEPGNWEPAGAPVASDKLFFPALSETSLILDGSVTTAGIIMEEGSLDIDLASHVLTVNGHLVAQGGLRDGGVILQGTGGTFDLSLPWSGSFVNATLNGAYRQVGEVQVSSLTISGSGASLDVGDNWLYVQDTGTFTTTSGGRLLLTSSSGGVTIEGHATFGGGSSVLSAGTMFFGGNFTQSGSANSFAASNDLTAHFYKTDGSTPLVSFADPVNSFFGELFISTTGGLTFATDAKVAGNLYLSGNGNISGAGRTIRVGGEMQRFGGNAHWKPATTILEYAGPGTSTFSLGNVITTTTALGITGRYDAYALALVGDVDVSGSGLFNVNAANVTIDGNFSTSGSGVLQMDFWPLTVTGNATFNGGDQTGKLNGGTLTVVGTSFTQGSSMKSFVAGENHTTVLTNPSVVVNFSHMGSTASHFGNLELDAVGTAVFTLPDLVVTSGDFTVFDGSTASFPGESSALEVGQDLHFPSTGGALQVSTVRLGRHLSLGTGVTYNVNRTVFAGTDVQIPLLPGGSGYDQVVVEGAAFTSDNLQFNALVLSGSSVGRGILTLGANIEVGDVELTSGLVKIGDVELGAHGQLEVDGHSVMIWGDLETEGMGALSMLNAAGVVEVSGQTTFAGGSTDGLLTAGQLIVRGNFIQSGTSSALSFAPSGTHLTRLSGTFPQSVVFANPDRETGSRFAHLEVWNTVTSGIELQSDIAVSTEFRMPVVTGEAEVQLFSSGGTHTISTASIVVEPADGPDTFLSLLNTQLLIDGASDLSQVRNIRWSGMPGSATQLHVVNGQTLTGLSFRNIQFQSLSTGDTGHYYIWNQTAGSADVDFQFVSPFSRGSFFEESGSVTVTWSPPAG
jgi:hypothetical protein